MSSVLISVVLIIIYDLRLLIIEFLRNIYIFVRALSNAAICYYSVKFAIFNIVYSFDIASLYASAIFIASMSFLIIDAQSSERWLNDLFSSLISTIFIFNEEFVEWSLSTNRTQLFSCWNYCRFWDSIM